MAARIPFAAALLTLAGTPAAAADYFMGIHAHGVDLPTTAEIHERGADFQLGYRFNRIAGLNAIGGPAPYLFASINDRGDTSLAAAGLSWRIGLAGFYLRPGIGVAVHTGPSYRVRNRRRTDLGSRVLFEPELAIGRMILPRVGIEASWVHVSHAQLFGPQNPGLDMVGARINFQLP